MHDKSYIIMKKEKEKNHPEDSDSKPPKFYLLSDSKPPTIMEVYSLDKLLAQFTFPEAQIGYCPYAWRSSMSGQSVLKRGVRFQDGSGMNINIWKDPWLPIPYSFKAYSPRLPHWMVLKIGEWVI